MLYFKLNLTISNMYDNKFFIFIDSFYISNTADMKNGIITNGERTRNYIF